MTDTAQYTSTPDGYRYDKYIGKEAIVSIPSHIEGDCVTVIGNKAFLSCKSVEELTLPDTVDRIEDWAFAHMHNLKILTLSAKVLSFGKKVFLDCPSLSEIRLAKVDDLPMGFSSFLASAFLYFPTAELTNLAGLSLPGRQEEWLNAYDPALSKYICQPDDYDFEPAFIGWFDVEDLDDQKQNYVLKIRRQKINLVLMRLSRDSFLDKCYRGPFEDYLSSHSDFILKSFCDRLIPEENALDYLKVLDNIRLLQEPFCQTLLAKRDDYDPEIKGYLMNRLMSLEGNDFFEDLLL